ncbi:MAG: hypothetical protein LBG19_04405 [Prevotellaceae bacterium]|jgi:hypothetical protein|nr:hypothetical protein [Prevotellaceae bacterium]
MKSSKISLQLLANTLINLSEQNGAEISPQNSAKTLSVRFDQPSPFDLGETKVIPFSFFGNPISFEIPETPYGWTVTLSKMNERGGTLAITASSFCLRCKTTLPIVLSNGITSIKQSIILSLNPYSIPVGTICYEDHEPMGIVFRQKTPIQKGLILHKKHTRAAWGCPKPRTYAIDKDNGLNNVNRIEAVDATFDTFPSFNWRRKHGDYWYMPSRHEPLRLFDNKDEVNGGFAWSVYFQGGHLNYHKKEYEKLVRTIRAF